MSWNRFKTGFNLFPIGQVFSGFFCCRYDWSCMDRDMSTRDILKEKVGVCRQYVKVTICMETAPSKLDRFTIVDYYLCLKKMVYLFGSVTIKLRHCSQIFSEMCQLANIRVKCLRGFAKGHTYTPGMECN